MFETVTNQKAYCLREVLSILQFLCYRFQIQFIALVHCNEVHDNYIGLVTHFFNPEKEFASLSYPFLLYQYRVTLQKFLSYINSYPKGSVWNAHAEFGFTITCLQLLMVYRTNSPLRFRWIPGAGSSDATHEQLLKKIKSKRQPRVKSCEHV